MNVILNRISDNQKETKGTLTCEIFTCNTLERSWLNNQPFVSCIPPGTYDCIWSFMGELKEWHYEVKNVPNRTGIFIHEGNFFTDTEGCILLGNSYNGEELLTTRATLAKFEKLQNKAPFTLVVINNNIKNNMVKYVKNFLTGGVVNTYNVSINTVESIGETHEFTSGADAVSKCTNEVLVLFDGISFGIGAVAD